MKCHSLVHLSDRELLRALAALVARDRSITAAMLAHLAEVDARRLHLPAAYPSMFAWCVGELKLSEDMAAKRIQAARAARRFPAILSMLEDGRLHLSAVVLLAPHLTTGNAGELLASAADKTKAEVERLLAERFPQPDLPARVTALGPASAPGGDAPGLPCDGSLGPAGELPALGVTDGLCENGEQHAPGHVHVESQDPCPIASAARGSTLGAPPSHPRLAPRAPGRFSLQLTISQETHDKLRYAQALLGHAVSSGDLAQLLDRALDALIPKLEQRRFSATARSRPGRGRRCADSRYVPAAVRRLVWRRDGGRCTFVSDTGRRCAARARLEFDHIEPFARGGAATCSGLRLRCRAHNQHEAERVYGAEFMRRKREQARRRSAEAREARRARERHEHREHAAGEAPERERAEARRARTEEVIPWLRSLGFSAGEARLGAARCTGMPDASLEQRVRAALSGLAPGGTRRAMPVASGLA